MTQYASDDGFDLVVYFRGPLAWEVLFVQTKAGRTQVMVSDIRELIGAIALRDGKSGLLVSVAGATAVARDASVASRVSRVSVDLADAYRLAEWIEERMRLKVVEELRKLTL